MKHLFRCALAVVTLGIPFVVAACYGAEMRFRAGKVVDANTKAGIPGIKVSCYRATDDAGSVPAIADGGFTQAVQIETSGPAGEFRLEFPSDCDIVVAEDVDGDANGKYARASTPVPPGEDEIVVPMVPE